MGITFKTATDFRKSLEARLQKRAYKSGEDLQRLRRKVAFDRLLARIFSIRPSHFLLKGGYAMELRIAHARATKDMDLTCMHRINNKDECIAELILQELQQLARIDINDYFVYQIGFATVDLENAPYGGARYPVSTLIADKLFVQFQIDVGADIIADKIENIRGTDWLDFCGISSPTIAMISLEQQLAEKIHAYTLPRNGRINSRVKDLIDMLLLLKMKSFKHEEFLYSLEKVFKIRNTHNLPRILEPPPVDWQLPFEAMAKECAIAPDMNENFKQVVRFYNRMSKDLRN